MDLSLRKAGGKGDRLLLRPRSESKFTPVETVAVMFARMLGGMLSHGHGTKLKSPVFAWSRLASVSLQGCLYFK